MMNCLPRIRIMYNEISCVMDGTCVVCSVSQRIDNGEPVLEMSISCAGLPLEMSDRHPTTYISVQTLCPPQQQWQQYKHTEVIEVDMAMLSSLIQL